MRKSRFTEAQIMAILGEGEAGLQVAQVDSSTVRSLARMRWP